MIKKETGMKKTAKRESNGHYDLIINVEFHFSKAFVMRCAGINIFLEITITKFSSLLRRFLLSTMYDVS